jgi:hypothetical protein
LAEKPYGYGILSGTIAQNQSSLNRPCIVPIVPQSSLPKGYH